MDGFEATVVEPGMATLENQVEWLAVKCWASVEVGHHSF